ncbi:MAG: hypothetical protein A3B74_05470 [Candidatus Kerfeldbacteria bacterium RIFCSPHIGHO2_02_FULL_42_14]|uniref:Integrase catalytic domain-containing protein n=1 Tax=Candidatus Kerfeldbacteria bacterium RIFCSPHIGHO2_02_FULL_42_14 TaxID=1798540 RepID=A0A1G2AT28_9BACT|nr:MAG: hypothetical protein A3B74_05470 [Candidatus Kerfeldbacteria bacterium RIFCSPHIGHO2_02_FULL_42_14]OGY83168.1 MAG: hypothetical protein A3I91_03185 [Candidatus Kerfeldbacteria bacterium RIFCSPLOWO2_02_FULL_42_19]OGY86279.1 MAG: hypothetical protein A3G01_00435 [Candidatus Kerfeldbacteria bacterium RIFCSPLOWO2_12_FULL_43_9]
MSKTIKEERLRWVLLIVSKEIRLVDAAKVCPYSKRTIERWVCAFKKGGESALEPRSTEPKTFRGETPLWVKERVRLIRRKTGKCAQKIHWQLLKEGIDIHTRTIGKILKKEQLVRKYRTKKVKYKYLRAERKPGELIEIDVKHVPGKVAGKEYFQYTAIDTASRWRYLAIYEEESSFNSIDFFTQVMRRFPYPILAIKTDNHSTFTNYYTGTNKRSDMTVKTLHGLDQFCATKNITHYLIDPGKPAQNGTVERSHREDEEKFYQRNIFQGVEDLKKKLKRWNIYYNNLEHCGLKGKTPNEVLKEYQIINPPNVCA